MSRAPRPSKSLQAVGARLRTARLALGLRTAQFSQGVGVKSNAYSQWEHGQRLLDVLVAVRIAERYGITLEWLYRGIAYGLPASLVQKILSMSETTKTGIKAEE
ncbi:MAG: helix-turn-helix domain-containing protein [Candidatus Binataceae bacterium]